MLQFPHERVNAMKRESISAKLKTAIRDSGKTVYRIALESGVPHPSIFRFLSGERDIRLETADKLAATLGLRLE
jgi:plasmid maintenance system antidote protein VapI